MYPDLMDLFIELIMEPGAVVRPSSVFHTTLSSIQTM